MNSLFIFNIVRIYKRYCWYFPFITLIIGMKISIFLLFHKKIEDVEYIKKNDKLTYLNYKINGKYEKIDENEEDWKILLNLHNATIKHTLINRTDPESVWLIYNKIPGTSHHLIIHKLKQLSLINSFSHQSHQYRTPWKRFLTEQEQENLVNWFEYQHLPKSYDRYFLYINFTYYQRYIRTRPIYINFLSEPSNRLRSLFNELSFDQFYTKGQKNTINSFERCVLEEIDLCNFQNHSTNFYMSIPYFCGQHSYCILLNDQRALARAKFTLDRYYSVVGILEYFQDTLKVFENYIGKFFFNVSNIYKEEEKLKMEIYQNKKLTPLLNKMIENILKKKLYSEYDLYEFSKQRLMNQLSNIQHPIVN